jgi:hypothetical protein
MRAFAFFTHMTKDRVDYEDLNSLPFPPGIEGAMEKMRLLGAIVIVVNEIAAALDLRTREGNAEPPEPKGKRVKAEAKN